MAVFRLNPDNEFSVGRDAAVTTRGFADSAVIPADFSVVQQEQLEHPSTVHQPEPGLETRASPEAGMDAIRKIQSTTVQH
jgi:hypothetical protein